MKTAGTPLVLSLLREGFASPLAAVLSLFACLVIGSLGWAASQWLLFDAVWPWQAAAECQRLEGICWPFLMEKTRFIFFGTYPYESHARPALVSFFLCLLAFVTGMGALGRGPKIGARPLAVAWAIVIVVSFTVMGGGVFGLQPVDPVRWNGLPILMMLSIIAVALAFPLGILLALARVQKTHRLLSAFSAGYIEIARGVPMLTVLFFGIFVLPLLLPAGFPISPIAATMVALVFFHASYFAEDIRGGLLSLPEGQAEAAKSLGMTYWQCVRLVVLPQAIRRSLPSLVNSIIGAYKDTSLVNIVGILDITATARMSFGDPVWRDNALEAYVLVGLWFFVSCAFLSGIGRHLHKTSTH